MPFRLPPNQAEALKDARKISDLMRRFKSRHGNLFLPFEREQIEQASSIMLGVQLTLRVPPEREDQ